jgi:MoxR-like ATPase
MTPVADYWDELVTTARLGTDRREPPVAPVGGLGDLAADCLRHRLVLSYEALAEGLTADALIAKVMARLPLPDKPMQHQTA